MPTKTKLKAKKVSRVTSQKGSKRSQKSVSTSAPHPAKPLSPSAIAVLRQLAAKPAVADGDIVSKEGRKELIERERRPSAPPALSSSLLRRRKVNDWG